MNLPTYIPQYIDEPVSAERLIDKMTNGSYKAVDFMRRLLEFTAIAVLGGDPLNDLTLSELKNQMIQKMSHKIELNSGSKSIDLAFKWAWYPAGENRTLFNKSEFINAVEFLCDLLLEQKESDVISRLIDHYKADEDLDLYTLFENFRVLGYSKVNVSEYNESREISNGQDNS